jgi:hypothetical protein
MWGAKNIRDGPPAVLASGFAFGGTGRMSIQKAIRGSEKWRVMIAAAALVLQAPAYGRENEFCPASPVSDQQGYLVEIRLCAADSPRCKPRGDLVYKARRADNREVETLSLPDIPETAVITGGELFTSLYDLQTRGFNNIKISAHGAATDYCSRHSLFDMAADWTGDDVSDNMRIEICLRFKKWEGAGPTKPCATP